jgi:hypothetical protein
MGQGPWQGKNSAIGQKSPLRALIGMRIDPEKPCSLPRGELSWQEHEKQSDLPSFLPPCGSDGCQAKIHCYTFNSFA